MRSFFGRRSSIADFERRRVLRPIFAPIVEARRRDVGVTQPLLHFGDVRLVLERVGRRRGAQRVRADRDAEFLRVVAHEFVNPISGECPRELAGAVVADRAEQGGGLLAGMAGGLQIGVTSRKGPLRTLTGAGAAEPQVGCCLAAANH